MCLFVPSLLAYQNEIDSITKRSKTAEQAYLSLYNILADAPDPAPLIASAADKTKQLTDMVQLGAENARLKEEMAQVQREHAALKSVDVVALKQRLTKYEATLDDLVEERVIAKEIELKQEMEEKTAIFKET